MLEYLRIRNLALIDDMALEFAPGLNVLSGETGAGKSFILKAVNFLTGERLATDMVRPGEEKALVEALFVLPEGEYAFRRELVAETGRSRLFINDALASQESLKALRPGLIVHASQHGQQRLLQPSYQARVLDDSMGRDDLLQDRDRLLRELKTLDAERQELEARRTAIAEKRDYLEYQRKEIEKVAPRPGEESELEARKLELREQARAGEAANAALELLHTSEAGLIDGFGRLTREMEHLARALPEFAADIPAFADFRLRLQELDARLRRLRPGSQDAAGLEKIEARLWELSQLKRRLNRPLDAIIELQQELESHLSFLDSSGLDIARLNKAEVALAAELADVLATCTQVRRDAAERLCGALEQELRALGFSEHVRVLCQFQPQELFPGRPELVDERARFLWQPNPGQPPQPLDKIASGGELSRFLLALVSTTNRSDQAALLFDEVDAGVGGITLNRVGERLQALAAARQIILITHWPQLAALADRHFQVRKEVLDGQTYTRCARLYDDDIVDELTRMAGGGEQGAALARKLKDL